MNIRLMTNCITNIFTKNYRNLIIGFQATVDNVGDAFWDTVYVAIYEGRSINSRTVLLSNHTVTVENQNHYEVVDPGLYITCHGFIYDVIL